MNVSRREAEAEGLPCVSDVVAVIGKVRVGVMMSEEDSDVAVNVIGSVMVTLPDW